MARDWTMHTRSRGDYPIAGRELVAEGADLRVQVMSLAAGQCVPWHYHSEISDSFVCLEGAHGGRDAGAAARLSAPGGRALRGAA
jgi:quercetin dioxygenase-like cupin family protein